MTLDQTAFRPSDRAFTFPQDFPAATNRLFLNLGNGKFSDDTANATLAGSMSRGVSIVPTDFDNHRDIDLLVVNRSGAPNLFSNQRDGGFRDVATELGLGGLSSTTCVASGDYNKDDLTDFFFGNRDSGGAIATSDGRGRFLVHAALPSTAGALAAQFVDYDNDGLLDLKVLRSNGLRVIRNL